MPSKSRSRSSSSTPTSTGILGGVLNFVSREFESFVANATANTSFAASSSRRTLDDEGDDDDEYDEEDEEEDIGHRRRARYSRHRSPTPPPRKCKSKSRRYSPTPSPPPPREVHNKRRERREARPLSPPVEEDHYNERQAGKASSCSSDTRPVRAPPSTTATQRCLKRKMSMTMPGSLFPRSPSMEPSELDATRYHEQHVRFAAPSTPVDNHVQCVRRNSVSLMPPPVIHSAPGGTPRKSPLAPTIKAVVNRFHVSEGDADPSILLPSPHHSPEALTRSTKRSLDKGKARALDFDGDFLDPNVSGVLRVKGKERELSTMREDLEQREQRMMVHQGGDVSFQLMEEERNVDKERIQLLEEEIARLKRELAVSRSSNSASYPPPPPAPPPPPLFPPPKKTLIPTTGSDDINMFASVRSHLKHAPPPVEKPINPATGRRPGKPTIGLTADQMAAFLTEMKTVRLRKVVDKPEAIANRSYRAPSPMRSARSFPRPSSRASLPQRLSQGDSSFENSASEHEGLSRRTSFPQNVTRNPVGGDNSASEQENSIRRGEKRKEAPGDDERAASRRRVSSSLDNSFSSTGSNGSYTQSDTQPPPSVTERSVTTTASRQASSSRWQSSSVTDAPTPSLCSDNEQETSPDDVVPSTPPAESAAGPSRGFYRFRGKGVPVDDSFDRSTYDHDVSMNEPDHESEIEPEPKPEQVHEPEEETLREPEPELEPRPHLPQEPVPLEPSPRVTQASLHQPKAMSKKTSMIPRPVHRPRGNLFDHRPPSSPMPVDSPRRPKPPARSSKGVVTHSEDDDIDAPLAMTFSPAATQTFNASRRASQNTPNPRQSADTSVSSTRSRNRKPLPKSPHPNKSRVQETEQTSKRSSRRHTLDHEIREAELPPIAKEILDDYDDYEGEVLTGVGTRDNQGGFLAHGGAGGPAVFMGVGYVQGARELDSRPEDDHDEYHPASDEDEDEYVPTPPRSRRR